MNTKKKHQRLPALVGICASGCAWTRGQGLKDVAPIDDMIWSVVVPERGLAQRRDPVRPLLFVAIVWRVGALCARPAGATALSCAFGASACLWTRGSG